MVAIVSSIAAIATAAATIFGTLYNHATTTIMNQTVNNNGLVIENDQLQSAYADATKSIAVLQSQIAEQPSNSTTDSPTSPAASSSQFLTDLSPDLGSDVQAGLARVAGVSYPHSFISQLCFGDTGASISVLVPAGMSRIKGVVGYDDGNTFDGAATGPSSSLHGMLVEASTDPVGLPDSSKTWSRIDDLSLKAGRTSPTRFEEALPQGVVAIRLRPDGYACSTTVDWADPAVS